MPLSLTKQNPAGVHSRKGADNLGMTDVEFRAAIMQAVESEVDEVVTKSNTKLNITQIEDMVLEVRQRFGERLTEELLKKRAEANAHVTPKDEETGKGLHVKGKKRKPSPLGLGS